LRAAVAAAEIPVASGSLNVTMSIGAAMALPHATGLTASDLITQADDALYLAKRGGRNRIELASAA
jgi:diguanylate cyclase (GGDEF)-like protein